MNTITLQRVRQAAKATFGTLTINGDIVATLEDMIREEKVYGETAIPAGTYQLELRNEGGKTLTYAKRFPKMHKGMIWLRNVPNFTYVYIHIGNFPDDTEGCILVGEKARSRSLQSSTSAYKRIYPKIVKMIESEGCEIIIKDSSGEDNVT
jgi:hypothetical protein